MENIKRSMIDNAAYKPKDLINLVGINQSNFDYWKRELVSNYSSKLYDGDVLAFKIIKEAAIGYRLSVPWLKNFNWVTVFSVCHQINPESLMKCRFVFDLVEDKLLFLSSEDLDPSPRKRTELCFIYMDELLDELYQSKRTWHKKDDINIVEHEEFLVAKFSKQIKESNP